MSTREVLSRKEERVLLSGDPNQANSHDRLLLSRRRFLNVGSIAAAGLAAACSPSPPTVEAPTSEPTEPTVIHELERQVTTTPVPQESFRYRESGFCAGRKTN